jgi:hypothetical protein
MPKQNERAGDMAGDVWSKAQHVAERAYDTATTAVEDVSDRVNDLSRFGKQRPLLAMAVAFLAGFFVAKSIL